MNCECENWARTLDPYKIKTRTGIPLVTNHHENCPHYNDTLMDVWRVSDGFSSSYTDNEQDAKDTLGYESEGDDSYTLTKEKMHREVFENLPEFGGF